MTDLKDQVLALPQSEKEEIFDALRQDLNHEPISQEILQVLEHRCRLYKSGEMDAAPAKEVFERLLKKYPA
ncbi:MAG: addiction module protein [Verrucomicrobiota bacterium]